VTTSASYLGLDRHAATQAAIVELDDSLITHNDDLVVDVLFAKLVLDHDDPAAMSFGQDATQQGRFSGSQKAGQHGSRDQRCHRLSTQ
jgi:hypothetical protein